MLDGFTSIGGSGLEITDFQPATRIMIPSIGINSGITELSIVDLGDSRAYESPDNTVGHIPESANAGEQGPSWFFGPAKTYSLSQTTEITNYSTGRHQVKWFIRVT